MELTIHFIHIHHNIRCTLGEDGAAVEDAEAFEDAAAVSKTLRVLEDAAASTASSSTSTTASSA